MSGETANEFNLTGALSEALKRKLMYLATVGSGSVHTGLHVQRAGAAAREKDGPDDELVGMMLHMATEEQARQLQHRIDATERRLIEALHENEELLRGAAEDIERTRKEAKTITMPDGSVRRVYRDDDAVRFEDGTLANPEILRADEASSNPRQWAEYESYRSRKDALIARRERLTEHLADIEEKREATARGSLTKEEADDIASALDEIEDSLEHPLATEQPAHAPPRLEKLEREQPHISVSGSAPAPG